MSFIGGRTEASSSEAQLIGKGYDERPSLSEVVVASVDTGTIPVPACASLMAATEALLEYASATAGLMTTANRLSGAQPGKLRQSNWRPRSITNIVDTLTMSFIYNLNNSGPNTDIYGHVTKCHGNLFCLINID